MFAHTLLSLSLALCADGTRAAATSQSRYRVVVEGSDCGPLEETRECFTPSDPCPQHYWSAGEWSQCQLAHDVRCGHGLRTRGELLERNYVQELGYLGDFNGDPDLTI